MSDLSIEYRIICKESQSCEMKTCSNSNPDKVYTTTLAPWNPGDCQVNWACDCWPFKKTGRCKHIDEAEEHLCKLDGYTDYLGEMPEDRKCPNCGGELTTIGVGV